MKCKFLLLTLCVFSAVSRISPPLKPALTFPLPPGDSLDNLHFSSSLVDISVHDLMCSNWRSGWKPRYLRFASRSSFLASYFLGTLKSIPDLVLVTHVVPALRRLAQISAVFFVSHVTTGTIRNVLACQTRSTPDLGPVMKAGAVRRVSKRLFLSIIPQTFHVLRRLMPMTP